MIHTFTGYENENSDVVCSVMMAPQGVAKGQALSDAQVKQAIIEESIAEYPGTCACPFNRARNGSSCGRRSAWSKAGAMRSFVTLMR